MRKSLTVLLGLVAVLAITSGALAANGVFDGPGPPGHIPTATFTWGGQPDNTIPVNTGGPFLSNVTPVGTTPTAIPAGTYLVTLNAKVTPTGTTPSGDPLPASVQVFPGLFLYTQDAVANHSFAGNVLNICNGPLEWGANNQIDGYCSGSMVLTLDAPTTLYVYAFGYDSDRGAGSYTLDDAELYLTQIDKAGPHGPPGPPPPHGH